MLHKLFLYALFIVLFVSCGEYEHKHENFSSDISAPSSAVTQPLKIARMLDKNNISIEKKIILEFSQELNATTLTHENIYIQNANATKTQLVIQLDYNNTRVTLTPKQYFKPLVSYTLVVTRGVKDKNQNTLHQKYLYQFVTLDTTRVDENFSVALVKPVQNSTNTDIHTTIAIEFNRFISRESINNISTLLELSDATGAIILSDVEVVNSSILLTPKKPLAYETEYTFTLKESLLDMYAKKYNIQNEKKRWSFTTASLKNAYQSKGFSTLDARQSQTQYQFIKTLSDSATSSSFVVASRNSLDLYALTYKSLPQKPILSKLTSLSISFQITALVRLNQNSFVIATSKNGLYTYKIDTNSIVEVSHIPIKNYIYGLFASATQVYSVGPLDGLRVYDIDKKSAALVEKNHIYSKKYIMLDVVATDEGNIFVAEYNKGLLIYDASFAQPKEISILGSVKKLLLDTQNANVLLFNTIGVIQAVDYTRNILQQRFTTLANSIGDVNSLRKSDGTIKKIFVSDATQGALLLSSDFKKVNYIKDKVVVGATGLQGFNPQLDFMALLMQDGTIEIQNLNADTKAPLVFPVTIPNNLVDVNAYISFLVQDDYVDVSEINKENIEFKNSDTGVLIPFNIALKAQSSQIIKSTISPKGFLKNDNNYTITIKDTLKDMIGNRLDANKTIAFRANLYTLAQLSLSGVSSVTEGITASYTIKLSKVAKIDVPVKILFKHITTDNTDVTPPPTSYVIKAGNDSVTINVTTINETIIDNNKDFSISLVNTTKGGGYILQTDTTAVKTTVINNDAAAAATPVTPPPSQSQGA